MKCERCGKATSGYDLHDYCRSCSKNLCADCMRKGCCGSIPAESGMNDMDAMTVEACAKVLEGRLAEYERMEITNSEPALAARYGAKIALENAIKAIRSLTAPAAVTAGE